MNDKSHILKISTSNSKIQEWALVLLSMGIDYEIINDNNKWILLVNVADKEKSENELKLFENENKKIKKLINKQNFININKHYFVITPLIFYLFFMIVRIFNKIQWNLVGIANAEKIINGEWWRTITSLTLHADFQHLLANITLGTFIAYHLCKMLGVGVGWFLILICGALGNYFNALGFIKNHYSLGASTAVFGAIGILGSIRLFGKFKESNVRAWLPFGGALGLLAVLGTAGDRTDIGAHFCGFGVGVFFGIIAGLYLLRYKIPSKIYQIIIAFVSLLILFFSWILAINT